MYEQITQSFQENPRDVHTVPLNAHKTPLWFHVFAKDGILYVTSAKNHLPSSNISGCRPLPPGNLKQCWSSIAAGKKENGSRKRQQKQPDVRYIGMEFLQTSDFEVTMKGSRSKSFGSPLAQRVGFEPTCGCPQTDFESLEAGVFWSILSASLRLSERRKPLILLGFPAFSLSAQGFWDFSHQSRFSGKV